MNSLKLSSKIRISLNNHSQSINVCKLVMGMLLRRLPSGVFSNDYILYQSHFWPLQIKMSSLLRDVIVCRDDLCLSKRGVGWEGPFHLPQMLGVGLLAALRSSHLAESRVHFSAAWVPQDRGEEDQGLRQKPSKTCEEVIRKTVPGSSQQCI